MNFNNLPSLPKGLLPYSNKDTSDVLSCFAHAVRRAYAEKHFSGWEDIDAALMSLLIELGLPAEQIHQVFQTVFKVDYDQQRTNDMYERTRLRIEGGSSVVGAGTFMMRVKDKGLNEVARFKRELENTLSRTREEKEPADILSQIFRWDDIVDIDVSVEWLLDGLIPKGAITLVFCPGGGGKTWLLMQIAQAIATGLPFGELTTIQAPVCFIDFENPLSVVKERREKIGPATDFYYWHLACPIGPPRLDDETWTDYKALPPGLLIFDTLRASHNGDENSSKDMALVLSRLKELREAGFTIIVLHHTPKGNDGTYKGSTAILDLADHVLSLEKQGKNERNDEFDPDAIYKFGCRMKTRFEPHTIFLTFDPAFGFSFREDPDLKIMKRMQDILKKEEPLNQTIFQDVLEDKLGMKRAQIFKLLKKGTGTFWDVQRGEKNAMLYSSFPCFPLTKAAENRKTGSGSFMT